MHGEDRISVFFLCFVFVLLFFFLRKREPSFAHLSYICRFAFFPRRRSRRSSRDQKRTNLRSSENSVLIPLTTPSFTIK